jgi:CDP-ribitol ribitolphosphotransferase
MKLRKAQNKILYLSRQSNDKSTDMKMLEDEIRRISPETKQVFRLRRLKDESAITLSYIFSIFGDMWEMASSRVVITDTYSIPVSCLRHKAELQIVQIWHAMGAVKKFSLQAAGKAQGRDSGVAKAMHMHENYTCVLAPSQETGRVYCEAFGCDKSALKILSLPRVDVILDGADRKNEFISLNPEFKGKEIVVYVPTFRKGDGDYAQLLHSAFSASEQKLVISAHPLSEAAQSGAYKFNGEFTSLDLMKLADAVITDYSACAFEGALLNKPLYFYIPDYEQYRQEQGLNVDVATVLPGTAFTDAGELAKNISPENYDFKQLSVFADKYVENKKTNNTELLASFICSLLEV